MNRKSSPYNVVCSSKQWTKTFRLSSVNAVSVFAEFDDGRDGIEMDELLYFWIADQVSDITHIAIVKTNMFSSRRKTYMLSPHQPSVLGIFFSPPKYCTKTANYKLFKLTI